jgi:hypothetical protein
MIFVGPTRLEARKKNGFATDLGAVILGEELLVLCPLREVRENS